MSGEYEIELTEPKAYRCDCCAGLTVNLTRFVTREGGAMAVYYARYSNNHPDNELHMLISLGDWSEGSDPAARAAFLCRVHPTEDSSQVMLGDASQSVWRDAGIVGKLLTRDAALAHPWKNTAFEVVDEAFLKDPSLRGYIDRAHCGNVAEPLERRYSLPDAVFALTEREQHRAKTHGPFVALDGKQFFVRVILPIPVEHYGPWNVGLWVEVARADYEHAQSVFNDPEEYLKLRFPGHIANDVASDLALPIALGAEVDMHVTNPRQLAHVQTPKSGNLASLMSERWSRTKFEEYALPRGLL